MSNRFNSLRELRDSGGKGLIPFITAGDLPHDITVKLLIDLTKAGANVIELGMPFSDPMADGPTIQRSTERALKNGTTLKDVLSVVSGFRKENTVTPLILMGYMNPVEQYGFKEFAKDAQAAGVDGVLLVDCPPEEAERSGVKEAFKAAGLDLVYLVAPTTKKERLEKIAAAASGFIYVVSLKGVTGSQALDVKSVEEHVKDLRAVTSLPIAVGFGIKTPETAVTFAKLADAVVIGSRLIEMIESSPNGNDPTQAVEWFGSVRKALDAIEDAK